MGQPELPGKRTVLHERYRGERGKRRERTGVSGEDVSEFTESCPASCPVSSAEFPIGPPKEMHRYLGYHSLCLNIVGNIWDNVSS